MQNRLKLCSFLLEAVLLGIVGCGGSTNTTTPPPEVHNEWTWIDGANGANNAPATYGPQGMAGFSYTPGARDYPVSWTDASGNFWLFGGYGYTSTSIKQGDLNDLWEFNSKTGWKWVSGSNQMEQPGTCGTKGVPSPTNIPGARYQAVSWIDPSGALWLFGGLGLDCSGTRGDLNDLWKYSNGEWTWMAGSSTVAPSSERASVYGTKGVPAPDNTPGSRVDASSWIDKSGNFWLFGGAGADSTGTLGPLNDLWEYSSGEWTWMGGSTLEGQIGIYGTEGAASADNMPGGRTNAITWTDASGNLWLFGGDGNGIQCEETGPPCELNDLWKYSNGEWTWESGSNIVNQSGAYGTPGMASAANAPGGRDTSVGWIDSSGNLWLFGGNGIDSARVLGPLNDLWKYSNGEWTWVSGSDHAAQAGTYGAQGVAAAGNVPGTREAGVAWTDKFGNLWLFGGDNFGSGPPGKFNDLWEYQP